MDTEPVDAVTALVARRVKAADLYLESVVVAGQGSARKVTVTVDLPADELGGVDMERVAELSRDISRELDEADVIAGAYRLEVTTPGVTRPLTEERHFQRARGRLARIETADGALVGRIRAVRDGAVILACADGDQPVALRDIERGRVQVEFNPPPPGFLDEAAPPGGGKGRGAARGAGAAKSTSSARSSSQNRKGE